MGQRGGQHVVDSTRAWQTGAPRSSSETSMWGAGKVDQQAAWLPSHCPFSPVGEEPQAREGTRLSHPVQGILGGSHCQKDPPPTTTTPKQGISFS